MSDGFATEVFVDPDVPLVRITREFAASASKVFLAHTDPDVVVRWNGPREAVMRIDHWDCRSGGAYRFVHLIGGTKHGCGGCFHDVRPEDLIVQTFTFDAMPDRVALEKLILADLGNGQTRLTVTSLIDSFADRDMMIASGWEQGVHESLRRLDTVLDGIELR